MKYYVVSDLIESENITEDFRAKNKLVFGFPLLTDAKSYAQYQTSRTKKQLGIYEIDVEGITINASKNITLENKAINYVEINLDQARVFNLISACYGDQKVYLDEYDLSQLQNKSLEADHLLKEAQRIERVEKLQETHYQLNVNQNKINHRLEKIQNVEADLKHNEAALYQTKISHYLEAARNRIDQKQLFEKEKQAKVARRTFYFKMLLFVGYFGGLYITADLLLKMGMAVSLSQLHLIGVSLISGMLLPASVFFLYYIGVGLKMLLVNDFRTNKEKHDEAYNKIVDDIDNIVKRHFKNEKDQIFINKLSEINKSLEDVQFEQNGRISSDEKQPCVNRDQFLHFVFDALKNAEQLHGNVRDAKEKEILNEARTKFGKAKVVH